MRHEVLSRGRDADGIHPTIWGYAVLRHTRCLAGGVPGLPQTLLGRTDVVVPGLTPAELERVRRHADWYASVHPTRLGTVAGAAAALSTLLVGHLVPGLLVTSPLVTVLAVALAGTTTASVHLFLRLMGPRLSQVERHALRSALEVRRARTVTGTSAGVHVLIAMSAVEGAEDVLDESQQALARELLLAAFEADRRHDTAGVRHATSAMLRLAVRAATARDGIPGEPLA
ncbi:hypothetical protein [Oerskovia flava]|uniref:hypothetical protein n=1 Tax=Oerskovia flava TaxID=2986422 RepID=UPI00223FFC42|nr:hypothetical protein [Oerskovia sp. JB1-3-2]